MHLILSWVTHYFPCKIFENKLLDFFFGYGNLHGFKKENTAERYGKEITHGWEKSYDIPPPNGESLEMCAERTVVYFRDKYIHVLFISICLGCLVLCF